MEYILGAGIFIIIFIIVPIIKYKYDDKKKKTNHIQDSNWLSTMNADITREYSYEDSKKIYRFLVDENNQCVYIIFPLSPPVRIHFDEIIGCESVIDDCKINQVGRAIIGGAILGEAGAIIGAATAKNGVSSYNLVLYLNNLQTPCITLYLITTNVNKSDYRFIQASQFSNNITSTVKAIIYQNEHRQ